MISFSLSSLMIHSGCVLSLCLHSPFHKLNKMWYEKINAKIIDLRSRSFKLAILAYEKSKNDLYFMIYDSVRMLKAIFHSAHVRRAWIRVLRVGCEVNRYRKTIQKEQFR